MAVLISEVVVLRSISQMDFVVLESGRERSPSCERQDGSRLVLFGKTEHPDFLLVQEPCLML